MKKRKRGRRAALRCLPLMLFSLLGWLLFGRVAAGADARVRAVIPGLSWLLFALLPGWAGLFAFGERRWNALPLGAPDANRLFSMLAAGALFVCPASLLRSLCAALTGEAAPPPLPGSLFAPALIFAAGVVPAAFALFYGGYLEEGLRPFGPAARVLPAALFALSGGSATEFLPRLCLALVLSALARRQRSLISAAAAHAAYLCCRVFLEGLGFHPLLTGTGLPAVMLLTAGSFAFARALLRALAEEPCGTRADFSFLKKLKTRDFAMLGAAGLLFTAAVITGVLL